MVIKVFYLATPISALATLLLRLKIDNEHILFFFIFCFCLMLATKTVLYKNLLRNQDRPVALLYWFVNVWDDYERP